MAAEPRFLKAGQLSGNIVFNFTAKPIRDLVVWAKGYHLAGHRLAERLAEAPHYADYEGYPVLFLYRHALELYGKAIVYRGAELMRLAGEPDLNTENWLLRKH